MYKMINLGDVVSFKLFNKCHIGIVCKKTPHAKKQYLVEYREYGNRLTILNNTPIRAWLRRKDIFGAIKECKMYEVKICAECGAQLERTPLVDLVKTYEVDDEDKSIFIQVWHRKCFASYETRTAVRQINAADATTEAPVNKSAPV